MADDRWLYAAALSSVTAGVVSLLVPLYVVALGGDALAVGAAAAVAAVAGAPGAVVAGRYADRTGNSRALVVVSLAASAGTLLVLSQLTSVAGVVLANAGLWFALSAVAPVLTTLAVAGVPEPLWSERIARLNKYQAYGSTAGFVLGAGWTATVAALATPAVARESLFVVTAATGVVAAVVAARSLPRERAAAVGPVRARRVATVLSRTGRHVRDATFSFAPNRLFWTTRSLSRRRLAAVRKRSPRALWAYFGAALLFFTGFAVFWGPLPVYLVRSGLGGGPAFGLYLLNNLASVAAFDRAGAVSASRDLRLVQGGALGLRGAAFVGVGGVATLALAPSATFVVGAFLLALVGVTWAFVAVAGTTIVSRLAPPSVRGEALGAYTALAAVAGGVGSLLGGWLATVSFAATFAAAAALVFAGAGIVGGVRRLSAVDVPRDATAPGTTD